MWKKFNFFIKVNTSRDNNSAWVPTVKRINQYTYWKTIYLITGEDTKKYNALKVDLRLL